MTQTFSQQSIQTFPESKKASDMIQNLIWENGGEIVADSQRGKPYRIQLSDNGARMVTDALPQAEYELHVFDIIVQLLIEQGGRARKGNRRTSRLGEGDCGYETVVGRIGRGYWGKSQGDWTVDPIMVLNAILCRAGICRFSEGGYMELSPSYLASANE